MPLAKIVRGVVARKPLNAQGVETAADTRRRTRRAALRITGIAPAMELEIFAVGIPLLRTVDGLTATRPLFEER